MTHQLPTIETAHEVDERATMIRDPANIMNEPAADEHDEARFVFGFDCHPL